ncbi:MAG: hypothetical protein K1X92_07685 [Bacteroidia bacterium]|nr:hypothetical protein [Bacteroidia bacterium]
MRITESFTPPFLKDTDRRLLLNHPTIWASRIHHLVFWAGILNFICFLWGRFHPIEMNNQPNTGVSVFFIFIAQAMVFLYWVYNVKIRGLEQAFGHFTRKLQTLDVFISLAGVVSVSLAMFAFSLGFQLNTRTLITKEQLVKDVNTLNIGQTILFPKYLGRGTSTPNYFYEINAGLPSDLLAQQLDEEGLSAVVSAIKNTEEENRYIQEFIHTANKYRTSPFDYPKALLSTGYFFSKQPDSLKNELLNTTFYKNYSAENVFTANPVTYEVNDNIRKIGESYKPLVNLYKNTDFSLFLFITGWITLVFMAFKRTSIREAALAAIAGVLLNVVAGMTGYIVGELYIVVFYSAYFMLGFFVFTKRNHARVLLLQKAGLALLVAASPLLTLVLFKNHDTGGNSFFPFLSIVVSFLLWFLAYNPMFIRLMARPKNQ